MIDIKIINKAILLTKYGRFDEAEAIYTDLMKNNPDDFNLLSVAGLFYVDIGNFDKASELLQKACSIKETLGTLSSLGFAEFEKYRY